eukprot:9475555-Pyramimonas_sp.AAC.2
MARSCAHRDQTRQGSNNFIDQIKCRGCGELLYKYNFAKVNDQMLLQCVRSRQYFDRLETTGSAQPGQAHPTGPSSATEDEVSATTRPSPPPPPGAPGAMVIPPRPTSLSAEVIRKLTDAEVEQIIENERMKIREEERSRLIKAIRMPTSSVSQQEPGTVITMVVDERSFVQQPPPEPDGGFHHLA